MSTFTSGWVDLTHIADFGKLDKASEQMRKGCKFDYKPTIPQDSVEREASRHAHKTEWIEVSSFIPTMRTLCVVSADGSSKRIFMGTRSECVQRQAALESAIRNSRVRTPQGEILEQAMIVCIYGPDPELTVL